MLYLEYNNDGSIKAERNFEPPLQKEELDKALLDNGEPRFRELIVAPVQFDPDTEKPGPFAYQRVGQKVRKVHAVNSLSAAERQQIQVAKALARRGQALPPREQEMEIIYETQIKLIEFCALLESVTIKLAVTAPELAELRARLAALKANPIP